MYVDSALAGSSPKGEESSPMIQKQLFRITLVLVLMSAAIMNLSGQQKDTPGKASENPDVNHLISEFSSGESEFKAAFGHYGYKCDLLIQTVRNGKVTGQYHRITQAVLSSKGKLEEKVLSFAASSVTEIAITRDDIDALSANYQFTLESLNMSKYKFTYAGTERIDNMDLYVFGVEPNPISSKELLFSGRIWVSVKDLRIVRMRGRAERKGNQKFPVLEIYRAAVDDRYLFPSYVSADEDVVFQNGSSVHLQMEVRYSDYVKLN